MNFAPGIAAAEFHQRGNRLAPNLRSENNDQILLAAKLISKRSRVAVRAPSVAGDSPALPEPSPSAAESSPPRNAANCPSVPAGICRNPAACRRKLYLLRVHHIQLRPMQPHVISNLVRQQRMLLRRIVSNQQNRRRAEHIAHGGSSFRLSATAPQRKQGSPQCGDDQCCWSCSTTRANFCSR